MFAGVCARLHIFTSSGLDISDESADVHFQPLARGSPPLLTPQNLFQVSSDARMVVAVARRNGLRASLTFSHSVEFAWGAISLSHRLVGHSESEVHGPTSEH